jgi:hypothetical protein
MGIGITNGINQVIDQTCQGHSAGSPGAFHDSVFFSPWPGWKNVMDGQFDPEYKDAAQDKYTQGAASVNTLAGGGDLMLALWGISKGLYQAFLAAGPNLTRQSFVKTMETFKFSSGSFPDVEFSPTNHFGAKNVHALRGECTPSKQFVEDPRYPGLRSSFS